MFRYTITVPILLEVTLVAENQLGAERVAHAYASDRMLDLIAPETGNCQPAALEPENGGGLGVLLGTSTVDRVRRWAGSSM